MHDRESLSELRYEVHAFLGVIGVTVKRNARMKFPAQARVQTEVRQLGFGHSQLSAEITCSTLQEFPSEA